MNDLICSACGIKEVNGNWSFCEECEKEMEENNENSTQSNSNNEP